MQWIGAATGRLDDSQMGSRRSPPGGGLARQVALALALALLGCGNQSAEPAEAVGVVREKVGPGEGGRTLVHALQTDDHNSIIRLFNLGSSSEFFSDSVITRVAMGDLQGDDVDELIIDTPGSLHLRSQEYERLLDGILAGINLGTPDVLDVADIDGNGRDEVVLTRSLGGPYTPVQVFDWLNGTEVTSSLPEMLFVDHGSLTTCDLNGDEAEEIITVGGQFRIYTAAADASWIPAYVAGLPPIVPLGTKIACADLNADGYDDLIVAEHAPIGGVETCLEYFTFPGVPTTFEAQEAGGEPLTGCLVYDLWIGGSTQDGDGIAAGDLNEDGWAEIVIARLPGPNSEYVKIYHAVGHPIPKLFEPVGNSHRNGSPFAIGTSPKLCAVTDAICDGKDEDCDGAIDEDWVPAACATRPADHPTCPGLTGLTACSAGVETCVEDADGDGSPEGPDSDRDGLLDRWETHGVDWTCDGVLEADLQPMRDAITAAGGNGAELADPNHADLFVEIDVEQGFNGSAKNISLSPADIQLWKEAFALSPVPNPDGTTGIRLWIDTPNGDPLGGGTFVPATGAARPWFAGDLLFNGATVINRCCYPDAPDGCPEHPGADSLPGNLPAADSYLDCRFLDTRARYFADPCCLPEPDRPDVCPGEVGVGTGGYDCATQLRGVENSQYRFLYFRYGLEAFAGWENPALAEDGVVNGCSNGRDDSANGDADFGGVGTLPPAPECMNDPFGAESGGALGSCNDGRDGDGFADAADPDCNIDPFLREPNGLGGFAEEGSCANGLDDNLAPGADRLKDVDDPDCMGLPAGELAGRPWTCFDNLDNDGDLLVDGADASCAGLPQEDGAGPGSCTNGIDDSSIGLPVPPTGVADFADGMADWDDPDCSALPREDLAGPNSCWDGLDNGDGVDTLDRSQDCFLFATGEDGLGNPETCFDGIDNQADRVADALDSDCWNFGVVPAVYDPTRSEDGVVAVPPSCGDGKDNSADGADAADVSDCPALPSEGNAGAASCFDGVDNNGDGVFDGTDPDCAGRGFAYPTEGGGDASSCTNAIDDDDNGVTDWEDCACNPRLPGCAPAPGAPRLPAEDGLGWYSCFDTIDNSSDGFDGFNNSACTYWGGFSSHPFGMLLNDHGAFLAMHEFGHSLGLQHGGPSKVGGVPVAGSGTNCNPPYLSVMNYSYAYGIPQAYDPTLAEDPTAPAGSCGDALGASEDADGLPNEFDPDCRGGPDILDYSPPRYPDPTQPSGWGRSRDLSALGLDEAAPREDVAWDPADSSNGFIFVYPGGAQSRVPLNGYNHLISEDPANPAPNGNCANSLDDDMDTLADAADPDCYGYDFDGSGSITRGAAIGPVNLNNGPDSRCFNGVLEVLNGPNDWLNLSMATFGPGRPGPTNVDSEPPLTPEQVHRNLLLTDFELELSPAPEVVVMNEHAAFVARLTNNGPALVASARLKLTLTDGLGFGALPDGCEVSGATALCLFGRLLPGNSIVVDFTLVPTSNPSGDPRFLRAEAIAQGNEEADPRNNSVDVRVVAESDLELLDVAPEAASLTLFMGETGELEVGADVVSHGPSNPVDSEVTFVVDAPAGVSVTPNEDLLAVPDLNIDPRTVTTAFTIECETMGVYTVELEATVLSAGLVYDDPNLTNNTSSTSFVVRCVPCVHATSSFVQADSTMVTSAQVHGGTYFELGANHSRVNADVFVAGNAFLRSTAIVDGDLTASGAIQTQVPYTITGVASPSTAVAGLPIESHTITTGSSDLAVPVSGTRTWTPGSYDEGFVGSLGVATLSAGTYNFRTLEVDADGTLDLDTSGGDIVINAQTLLKFGDRSTVLPSGAGRVRFYTNATSANMVRIGTDVKFRASVSAPAGTVHAYSRTRIDGCLAGKTIKLEPNITLAQPSLGSECSAGTYEVESITHSTGAAIAGGWNLYANGHVTTTHTFTPGAGTLWITAKGEQGGGQWPRMKVLVGGTLVHERFVNTSAWTTYQVPISAAGGAAEIRIVFDNDFYGGAGNDRNLHLDRIFVDCVEW